MAKKTDSNIYTVIFAVIMVVVVGSLLAFVASSLKPRITENQRYEKMQNILYAMGVNNNDPENKNSVAFIPTTEVSQAFDKYITKQLVVQGDNMTEDDQAFLIDIAKEETQAKNGTYQKRMPIFIGEKDGNTLYVVPVAGKGLWDAIWGYVALDKDLVVQGAFFDHKAETPGLGANIKERFFMDDFVGEHIVDASGNFVGITVAKGNNDPLNNRKEDHKVDAIAGSTITGDGVSKMIKKSLQAYLPHLKTLTQE